MSEKSMNPLNAMRRHLEIFHRHGARGQLKLKLPTWRKETGGGGLATFRERKQAQYNGTRPAPSVSSVGFL